jgi:hypothetical protein
MYKEYFWGNERRKMSSRLPLPYSSLRTNIQKRKGGMME